MLAPTYCWHSSFIKADTTHIQIACAKMVSHFEPRAFQDSLVLYCHKEKSLSCIQMREIMLGLSAFPYSPHLRFLASDLKSPWCNNECLCIGINEWCRGPFYMYVLAFVQSCTGRDYLERYEILLQDRRWSHMSETVSTGILLTRVLYYVFHSRVLFFVR